MKDFIFTHYREIIVVVWFLLEFIISLILLCKKQKVKDVGVFQNILERIPSLISDAESLIGAGSGILKKDYVLQKCLLLYQRMTGVELSKDSWIFENFSNFIESVLKTPTKK